MANITAPQAPKKTGTIKRWLFVVAACLVIVAVLGSLKYRQIAKAIAFAESFPERSEAVTAVTAMPVNWPQRYRTIGEVKATQYIELRTELDGKISYINFVGGDIVSPGQILLKLDSREEQAALQATRAQLKLADLQLQRQTELRDKKLASNNDYDRAQADKNVLQANVAALTASIDKKTLTAPFAAKTGLHNLQAGQYLAANSLITELSGNSGSLWIDFNLPQEKASLAIGDRVEISGRGLTESPVFAAVISADAQINSSSRNRGYRALIKDTSTRLVPGSVVDVEVIYATLNDVFKLPASAVRHSNFGAYLYILNAAEPGAAAAHRAERRQVSIVATSGSDIFVSEGIKAGELVAAIGSFKLKQGLLAQVVERVQDGGHERTP